MRDVMTKLFGGGNNKSTLKSSSNSKRLKQSRSSPILRLLTFTSNEKQPQPQSQQQQQQHVTNSPSSPSLSSIGSCHGQCYDNFAYGSGGVNYGLMTPQPSCAQTCVAEKGHCNCVAKQSACDYTIY